MQSIITRLRLVEGGWWHLSDWLIVVVASDDLHRHMRHQIAESLCISILKFW